MKYYWALRWICCTRRVQAQETRSRARPHTFFTPSLHSLRLAGPPSQNSPWASAEKRGFSFMIKTCLIIKSILAAKMFWLNGEIQEQLSCRSSKTVRGREISAPQLTNLHVFTYLCHNFQQIFNVCINLHEWTTGQTKILHQPFFSTLKFFSEG